MSQLKIKDGNNWVSIPAGGIGVPSGGTAGQVLKKSSSTDYATEWANANIGFAFDTLFDSHSANVTTGDKALSGNVNNYTMLIAAVFVPADANNYACLHWIIPNFQIASGNIFEVLNPPSGSLNWFVRFTLKFNGTTMTVINSAKAGYTTAGLAVYGIKFPLFHE